MIALLSLLLLSSSLNANDLPRVFVTDSEAWEVVGAQWGSGYSSSQSGYWGSSGSIEGGGRPQIVEIMKTFEERCPKVSVTTQLQTADYVVRTEREGGKKLWRKDNKIALINKDGDLLMTSATRTVGAAVNEVCLAIRDHFVPRSKQHVGEFVSPAEYTGQYWIRLDEPGKRAFVLGYLAALERVNSQIQEFFSETDQATKPTNPLLAVSPTESRKRQQAVKVLKSRLDQSISKSLELDMGVDELVPRTDLYYRQDKNLLEALSKVIPKVASTDSW